LRGVDGLSLGRGELDGRSRCGRLLCRGFCGRFRGERWRGTRRLRNGLAGDERQRARRSGKCARPRHGLPSSLHRLYSILERSDSSRRSPPWPRTFRLRFARMPARRARGLLALTWICAPDPATAAPEMPTGASPGEGGARRACYSAGQLIERTNPKSGLRCIPTRRRCRTTLPSEPAPSGSRSGAASCPHPRSRASALGSGRCRPWDP